MAYWVTHDNEEQSTEDIDADDYSEEGNMTVFTRMQTDGASTTNSRVASLRTTKILPIDEIRY